MGEREYDTADRTTTAIPTAATEAIARPWGTVARGRARPLARLWQWYAARGVFAQALMAWVITRFLLALVTFATLAQRHLSLSHFFSIWVQWDAGWYLLIERTGYVSRPASAFFPLYPFAIHVSALALPFLPPTVIAILISNLATYGAMVGIGLLASFESGTPNAAPAAILVMIAYPCAFFLAAPYTEGLFLVAAIFAVYCARRGYWVRAAALVFVATLTRSTGLILLLPLLYEYGAQQKWWQRVAWMQGGWRARLRPRVLLGALLPGLGAGLAFAVVILIDARAYAHPFQFLNEEAVYWHHTSWTVWQTLGAIATNVLHPPATNYFRLLMVLNLVPFALMIVLTLALVRRLSPTYLLYLLGLFYLVGSTPVAGRPDIFPSAARYLLVAFPLFLEVAHWGEGHPRVLALGIAAGVLVQLAFTFMWLHGIWVE